MNNTCLLYILVTRKCVSKFTELNYNADNQTIAEYKYNADMNNNINILFITPKSGMTIMCKHKMSTFRRKQLINTIVNLHILHALTELSKQY